MKTNFKTNRKQTLGTILKSLIAALIIVASASVNGQDFWSSNESNSFNTVSLISANYTNSTAELFNFSAMVELESEKALELEAWMTAEETFGTFINTEQETEEPMELESWMTDVNSFTVDYGFEAEKDAELELEDWMKNEKHFSSTKLKEEPLQLEAWMVAANFGIK